MATTNFTFTTLTGTETAGWNSINTLLTSIDTQLNASNRLVYMSGWSAVAGQTIKWDAANSRWVPGTLDAAAFANNSVELGTKTTGDYVASIAAAGTNEVSVTGSGEGAAATVRLANNTALRGAATVETPPTYSGGSTGTVGRVPDAKYVTDALAYATSGNVTLGGDVTGNASANTIANNAVTDAKLRDSSGLSVIGRSANTSGDPADIIAGTDNHVLRRSGTSVGFGQVATDGIANNAITSDKIDLTIGGQLGLNQTGATRRVTATYAPEATTTSQTDVLTGLTNVTINTPGEGVITGIFTTELRSSNASEACYATVKVLNGATPISVGGRAVIWNSSNQYEMFNSSGITIVTNTAYKKVSLFFQYVPVFYASGTNSVFNVYFRTTYSIHTAYIKNSTLSLTWTQF